MPPVDAVLDRSIPAVAPVPPPPAAFRVLVASAQRDGAASLRQALAPPEFLVVTSVPPGHALASIAGEAPDLALVDVNHDRTRPPGDRGLDLIAALKTRHPLLPVVAVTAASAADLAVEAMQRGARAFVEQPCSDRHLRTVARSQAELGRALRRVAALEAEVQRMNGGVSDGAATNLLGHMRLLEVEGLLVRQAMERYHGNISRAARALGLSRSALYRRLERHKI
jgi:DNA-binding NtrC family response regulator